MVTNMDSTSKQQEIRKMKKRFAAYIIVFTIFLFYIGLSNGLPKTGMEALLPNYLLISTAILAVTFAAVAINKDIMKKETEFVELTIGASTMGIFVSIISLYLCYLQGDSHQFTIPMTFYFATFLVITSILTMAIVSIQTIRK
jgi:hypothetical protein